MTIDEVFDSISGDEWLNAIEPYQMMTLKEMGFDGSNSELIAERWLKASTANTVPFGTEVNSNLFLVNLKKEVIKLICDETAYIDIKEQINKLPGGSPAVIVSIISAAIAPVVGTSSPLITPIVSLLLYSFGKITKNAFCRTYYVKE